MKVQGTELQNRNSGGTIHAATSTAHVPEPPERWQQRFRSIAAAPRGACGYHTAAQGQQVNTAGATQHNPALKQGKSGCSENNESYAGVLDSCYKSPIGRDNALQRCAVTAGQPGTLSQFEAVFSRALEKTHLGICIDSQLMVVCSYIKAKEYLLRLITTYYTYLISFKIRKCALLTPFTLGMAKDTLRVLVGTRATRRKLFHGDKKALVELTTKSCPRLRQPLAQLCTHERQVLLPSTTHEHVAAS